MRWHLSRVPAKKRDPAASMALLQEVLDRPLDPGYASAAARRVSEGKSASTPGRTPLLIATSVVLGLVFSTSAVALRAPDSQGATERAELAERVEAEVAHGDELSAQIEELRSEVSILEETQLNQQSIAGGDEIRDLGEAVGATALVGPGVAVTMDDAPMDEEGRAAESSQVEQRVLARDLQILVNGLWAAGAEGIVINEQRLTSTSSIRFAGEAIVVDFRGLTPPYSIRAIGDPELLSAELTEGSTGAYLQDLNSELGILSEVLVEEEMTIPAAERLSTNVATVQSSDTQEGNK